MPHTSRTRAKRAVLATVSHVRQSPPIGTIMALMLGTVTIVVVTSNLIPSIYVIGKRNGNP